LEPRIAGCNALNLLKVIELVRCDVKETAAHERAVNRLDKILGDKTATMMTPLRPRIRKKQIKFLNRVRGQQIAHSVGNFNIHNAHVVEGRRFSAGFRDATGEFVDPEKIFFRAMLRELAQKRAIPATKIDMEWRSAAKDRDQVELRDVRFRNQLSHGTSMKPLRGNSTAQRLKISTGLD